MDHLQDVPASRGPGPPAPPPQDLSFRSSDVSALPAKYIPGPRHDRTQLLSSPRHLSPHSSVIQPKHQHAVHFPVTALPGTHVRSPRQSQFQRALGPPSTENINGMSPSPTRVFQGALGVQGVGNPRSGDALRHTRPLNPHSQTPQHPPKSARNLRPQRTTGYETPGWTAWYEHAAPVLYLEQLLGTVLKEVYMSPQEHNAKLKFAHRLQRLTKETVSNQFPTSQPTVTLQGFGSFASGFALTGSDMDMVLMISGPAKSEINFNEIANALKDALRADGLGVYVISNTRVPIIKICETPPPWFLEEQAKREAQLAATAPEATNAGLGPGDRDGSFAASDTLDTLEKPCVIKDFGGSGSENEEEDREERKQHLQPKQAVETANQGNRSRNPRRWFRERPPNKTDFPKTGAGILCDINMENPLGVENTHLLRCYAACDVRVHPMVTFVKAWASRRKINSSRDGTLSSYGYVLMVIHFLVHVVRPPVLPNLQHPHDWPNFWEVLGPERSQFYAESINGHSIQYVRNIDALREYGSRQISPNTMPVGRLLAEFFAYYGDHILGGHSWQGHVISLCSRHPGVLEKCVLGWTRATTEIVNGVEVRQRYLLAIQDPFETSHNVARTVTNEGAGAMRMEFKRAATILRGLNATGAVKEGLMQEFVEHGADQSNVDALREPTGPSARTIRDVNAEMAKFGI